MLIDKYGSRFRYAVLSNLINREGVTLVLRVLVFTNFGEFVSCIRLPVTFRGSVLEVPI
jgi:hypothetical protein